MKILNKFEVNISFQMIVSFFTILYISMYFTCILKSETGMNIIPIAPNPFHTPYHALAALSHSYQTVSIAKL